MQLSIVDAQGQTCGNTDVADAAFGAEYNEALVHQVVTAYFNAGRAGTKAQKTRSEVRGGGRKPWRQKGTGNARTGSIRNPIWRGGGRALAAKPRDYSQKVNRKMYRGALRSVLSELVRQERLLVVESFEVEAISTKALKQKLLALGLDHALVVLDEPSDALLLSARNLHWVELLESRDVSPALLVGFEKVVITVSALKALEERLQ